MRSRGVRVRICDPLQTGKMWFALDGGRWVRSGTRTHARASDDGRLGGAPLGISVRTCTPAGALRSLTGTRPEMALLAAKDFFDWLGMPGRVQIEPMDVGHMTCGPRG